MVRQDLAISRAAELGFIAVVQQSAIAGIRAWVGRCAVLVAAMAAAIALTLSATARAATITVNSLADLGAAGICVLRDAITAANTMTATNGCVAGTGSDIIQFSVTGTILLTSTLPQVTDSLLAINGPASPGITIDGGFAVEVMQVAPGAVLNLKNLTIAHGSSVTGGGGAISNDGTLTMTNSTVSGSSAFSAFEGAFVAGGGISNGGTLTVTNSTVSGNSAVNSFGGIVAGGGISNGGTLTVINSTVSGNFVEIFGGDFAAPRLSEGGGIFNGGTIIVINSTISGNSGRFGGLGGGIFNGGTIIVTNSTFSRNSVVPSFPPGCCGSGDGGGIFNEGTLFVSNSTFAGNAAVRGAAISNPGGSASLKSTVLFSIGPGPEFGNCSSRAFPAPNPIIDAGFNISNDFSCGFAKTGLANNGDGVDPLLSPNGLTDNGGPTETIALASGSPAIDTIPVTACTDQASPPKPITTDQRDMPRPDFGEDVCDIGAFESQETFAGPPGAANCHGQSVSALSNQYGTLDAAASALGFPSVQALQDAIKAFCEA